jgi:DNA-binding transcriptional LysR family regulator
MWRLDDISVFVTVVAQGSFVQAAEQLDMPTSTVSRRISELETALEIKLIERTSRKLRVTERGQLLYEQCLPLVKNMRYQVDTLTRNRDQLTGKITVTAPIYLASAILSPWLCQFLFEHPDIELDLKLSNRLEDLLDEGIDLAIRVGPLRDSQFVAQYLFTARYGLYASQAYLQSHEPIHRPEDLRNHDVWVMAHQKDMLTLVDVEDREQTVNTATRMKCTDIDMARQMAINGLCIACLPRKNTRVPQDDDNLLRVLEQYEITPTRDVYVVYPSRKHLPARTRLLIDFLKAAVTKLQ